MRPFDQLKISIPELAKAPEGSEAFNRLVAKKVGGPFRITKRAFDFRKGHEPCMVLSGEYFTPGETIPPLPTWHDLWQQVLPHTPAKSKHRPVVVGAGPAGLFCALALAKAGQAPLVIERGDDVQERSQKVQTFWDDGKLDPDSNVQFGEGGAGTFSDGKLTTLVKEKGHLGRLVLETFIAAGAPEAIRFVSKPHIGTDILRDVVVNVRKAILQAGGEVRFHTKLTGLRHKGGQLQGVEVAGPAGKMVIETHRVFLCIGHSARDTFQMLADTGVAMEQKPFSVGLRVQHPQALINEAQYGAYADLLGERYPADYKLSYHASTGRGVYTFCMCPGGFVVNAASENGGVVTNGMSNHARNSGVANAAVLVNVTPEDFVPYAKGHTDVLAGMHFQRHLEQSAFRLGGETNALPMQSLGNFMNSKHDPVPYAGALRGTGRIADLTTILPAYVTETLREGLAVFDVKLKGFADSKALLVGIESRTSSPIRIVRGADGQSSLTGLYPVGEGAGYAGGIMSAAIDGIRAALAGINI